MNGIDAYFFDGRLSKRAEVKLVLYPPETIRIVWPSNDTERTYKLGEVRISSRIANTPRAIYFPDDSKCEVADNDAIDEFLSHGGKKSLEGHIHTLESRFIYAIAAAVVTVMIVWGFIEFGLPTLAKRAAFALPPSVNASLGTEGLELLDRMVFSPSELGEEEKKRLTDDFNSVVREFKDIKGLRLEFRKSTALGANAIALPSGIIVVTDAFVELIEDDNEAKAVIAHEAGHVAGRHSLRMLLQSSAVALIVSTITGDVTSITALSATLPTIMLEAKFSKEFETEADDYSYDYLVKNNIPTVHFANILERMTEARGVEKGSKERYGYLSSHPATNARVKRFKE